MPTIIVKLDPNEDFYVLWSSVVDAPTSFGTRAQITEHLLYYDFSQGQIDDGYAQRQIDARFERADERGTSSMVRGDGDWSDEFFMYMQEGLLRRDHLKTLYERMEALDTDYPDVSDLLIPFEDD
jgi:hypothetical protein